MHKRWPNSSAPGTNFQPWDFNKTFVSCRLGWQNRKTNLNLPKSASLVIHRGTCQCLLTKVLDTQSCARRDGKIIFRVTRNLFGLLSFAVFEPNATRTRYMPSSASWNTQCVCALSSAISQPSPIWIFRQTLETNFLCAAPTMSMNCRANIAQQFKLFSASYRR